jgi:hypothetical protein
MTPNELDLKFAADKIVPMVLIVIGAVFYKIGLPELGASVSGAGLLAFQIDRKSPANPSQPQQGPTP